MFAIAALALWIHSSYAERTHLGASDIFPNPFRTIESPLRLPEGRELGWVMGVGVDRNGKDVWVYDTCGGALDGCLTSTLAPILRFDDRGKFLTGFGAGLAVHPHGLHIDHEGNLWVVDGFGGTTPDVPGKGHQVFKFSREGNLLLTLGTAGVRGRGTNVFNTPSDVLVAPNGDIFVADGHGGQTNDRIVKFTKDGTFVKEWGTKGAGPGQFSETHSLAMDSRGRLFVGDRRNNNRIQIFDQNGNYLEEWKQFGAPAEIFIDKRDTIYVADGTSDERSNPGFERGIRIGSARTGTVTQFIPDVRGGQELVTVDGRGAIFGAWTGGRTVKKYVRH